MRTGSALVFGLSLALVAGACSKPDFLEMNPKEHTFKRTNEELWWKATAKTRQGQVLHKEKVTWSSSDEKVAKVDFAGRVTSMGPGRATIIARSGEVKAEALVEVLTVGRVEVEPKELTLKARGEPQAVTVKVFDYQGRPLADRLPMLRCQNENVCRTSQAGVVPVDPGETVLVVSADPAKTEIPIKVVPNPDLKED